MALSSLTVIFLSIIIGSNHCIKVENNKLSNDPDGIGYIAAVVNYSPIWENDKNDTINIIKNLERYCSYINDASLFDADVIIFPAGGLSDGNWSTLLPEINLPLQNQPLLKLSDCAKRGNIYVVLTVSEQLTNNNLTCLSQIVINRDGNLVAKNQDSRCRLDNNANIEEEIFILDNGIKIALMLNDDLYNEDRLDRLKNLQINNFALSYNLNGSLPFYTAIQTEWSWSYGNDATLMAASLGAEDLGSGLYFGRSYNPLYLVDTKYGYMINNGGVLIGTIPTTTNNVKPSKESATLKYHNGGKQIAKRSHGATASAWASAYASVYKREIKDNDYENEQFNDDLNDYNKIVVNVSQTSYINDNYLEYYNLKENLCSNGLCCTFKMAWKIRYADSTWYEDSLSDDDLDNDYNYDGDETGCYLLMVGGNVTEDIHAVNGSPVGKVNVDRCAIIYTKNNSFCQQVKQPETMTNSQTGFSSDSLHYIKLLNRNNVILEKLEITANRNGMIPNILLDYNYIKLPLNNMFSYSDLPTSNLTVSNKFRNFVTYGLQKISNYTRY